MKCNKATLPYSSPLKTERGSWSEKIMLRIGIHLQYLKFASSWYKIAPLNGFVPKEKRKDGGNSLRKF